MNKYIKTDIEQGLQLLKTGIMNALADIENGNEEEISFSVNDITCASTLKVNNEKVIMPVTSTENNIAYLIIMLLDLGGLVFVKKSS